MQNVPKILRGPDAVEMLDELIDSLVALAEGLEAIDLDDLMGRVSDPNKKLALLAASEYKSAMASVLAFRRTLH